MTTAFPLVTNLFTTKPQKSEQRERERYDDDDD